MPVRWVPDNRIRSPVAGLTLDKVCAIIRIGGRATGIGPDLKITDRSLIQLYLLGLSRAVRPLEDLTEPQMPTGGIVVQPDRIDIDAGSKQLSFEFYAGWLPGSRRGMQGIATISPEFVYALHQTGIRDQPRNTLYRMLLLRQSGVSPVDTD
jgi:hypothetical protein